MCFYSKISKQAIEIENRFSAKFSDSADFKPKEIINAYAYPKTPIISNKKNDEIIMANWGLIPKWSKDISIRKYTLNAKIETLKIKPSFKNNIYNRCLIIVDGFYEWRWLDEKGKQKEKYLMTLKDNELFAFAGIFDEWTEQESGEIITSYSIITTEANEQMSYIHNSKKRMPVILEKEQEMDWLSTKSPIENFKKVSIELNCQNLSELQLL